MASIYAIVGDTRSQPLYLFLWKGVVHSSHYLFKRYLYGTSKKDRRRENPGLVFELNLAFSSI